MYIIDTVALGRAVYRQDVHILSENDPVFFPRFLHDIL